jgi:hypothetical protein
MALLKSTLLVSLAVLSLTGCAVGTNANNATLRQMQIAKEQRAQANKVWDGLELPAG